MQFSDELIGWCREQFPALTRQHGDRPALFLDGPAGTQVPQRVIDAIGQYLRTCNANHGGVFATSVESDTWMDRVHEALAQFVGSNDPGTIAFGPNMTTMTFSLSRALGRTWKAGDEIIVTRLDHDANVTPWVLAARDAGARVRFVELQAHDCTLDLDSLKSQLSDRTRLVAVGCASNSTGTVNPVRQIARWAHDVGALVFLDAVHYAPHALIDVETMEADFLAGSTYKFFGPHIGVRWGKRQLLEQLEAYRLRPTPDDLPGKWMNGTQNFECLAGTLAAVDYLADLGRRVSGDTSLGRREALIQAFAAIGPYERRLVQRLLQGLADLPAIRVWGIRDPDRLDQRLPTVSITHHRLPAEQLARRLAEQGVYVWHGNYYALQLTETLGLEPDGMVRIGLVHYNTAAEVDRLLELLARL